MKEGLCAGCGQWIRLKDESILPYHDWPKPTRRVCSGAKTPPLQTRKILTMELVKEWRQTGRVCCGGYGEVFSDDDRRHVDWLIERAERSLCTLVEIARHSEDEDGERPTPEAKLARKTLRKLGHVES